ncbi:MAG: hypothetical protein K6C09_01855 [Oscillospiraceae bacterium]|nr:hypothetical protein [Oscillospiraceae bacterium]
MSRQKAEQIYDALMESYSIKDASERWADYRKNISDFLIANMAPGRTVAMFGAGEADDVDLARVYAHAGRLDLYDLDPGKPEKALRKYGLSGKPDVNVFQNDLFGVTKEEYIGLIELCLNDVQKAGAAWTPAMTAPRYLARIRALYDRINRREIDFGGKQYDYTIMIGVHSQLNTFLERIWSVFLDLTKQRDFSIAQQVIAENEIYIPRVNQGLLDMTREKAFVGLEVEALDQPGTIQGAVQAIADIEGRIRKEAVICDSAWMDVWPFREGKEYQMVIYQLDKT